ARELINLRDRLNFVAPQTLVETELPPSARPTQPAPAEEAAARQLPAEATNWAEEVKVAYQAGNGEELASLANRSVLGAFAAWKLIMAELAI
ncbi:hypothetical protein HZB07_01565, partial [Candidatus Saganbacteria bacterium]|nr:hypothetical protein [Candidatus Saganbacteria bacterium]